MVDLGNLALVPIENWTNFVDAMTNYLNGKVKQMEDAQDATKSIMEALGAIMGLITAEMSKDIGGCASGCHDSASAAPSLAEILQKAQGSSAGENPMESLLKMLKNLDNAK